MFAAYCESLISYARQRAFWVLCLLIVGWAACWLETKPLPKNWLFWPLVIQLVSLVIALYVCGRLSDYRQRLLPYYRQVHLTVLATFCLTLLTSVTIWMQLRPGDAGIAPLGAMVLACAAGCWAVRWPGSILLLMVGTVLGTRQSGPDWFRDLVAGPQIHVLDLSLLVAGVGLFVLFVKWLWNLTEDEARALPPIGRAGWQGRNLHSGFPAGQQLSPAVPRNIWWWLAERNMLLQEWRLELALRRGPTAFGWSDWRWQLPWSPILLLPLMSLLLMAGAALPLWFFARRNIVLHFYAIPTVLTGQWILAQLFAPMVFVRRSHLGIESLRAVSREQFFRQLGAGLLAQWLAIVLLIFGTLGAISWYCESPAWADAWRFAARAIPFLSAQVVVVAAFFWLLRFKSVLATAAAICCLMLVSDSLVGRWALDLSLLWQLGITAAMAACSAALLWDGYHRWLVMDLE